MINTNPSVFANFCIPIVIKTGRKGPNGTGGQIRFESIDKFLHCFRSGLHHNPVLYFEMRTISLQYGRAGRNSCVLEMRFIGGSKPYFKDGEHCIRLELPFSVYQVWHEFLRQNRIKNSNVHFSLHKFDLSQIYKKQLPGCQLGDKVPLNTLRRKSETTFSHQLNQLKRNWSKRQARDLSVVQRDKFGRIIKGPNSPYRAKRP